MLKNTKSNVTKSVDISLTCVHFSADQFQFSEKVKIYLGKLVDIEAVAYYDSVDYRIKNATDSSFDKMIKLESPDNYKCALYAIVLLLLSIYGTEEAKWHKDLLNNYFGKFSDDQKKLVNDYIVQLREILTVKN